MSYVDLRGQANLPRGFRNNNPLNLVRTNIKWQGKVPHDQSTDPRFEQFERMEDGLRAGMIDILGDIAEGKNTLRKLIYEFAPPHENHTENYIKSVAKALGVSPDAVLKLSQSQFKTMIDAMVKVENARNLPIGVYERAFALVPQKKKNCLLLVE